MGIESPSDSTSAFYPSCKNYEITLGSCSTATSFKAASLPTMDSHKVEISKN